MAKLAGTSLFQSLSPFCVALTSFKQKRRGSNERTIDLKFISYQAVTSSRRKICLLFLVLRIQLLLARPGTALKKWHFTEFWIFTQRHKILVYTASLKFFITSKLFNNYSSSPNGPSASWAIDSEAMRARGMIVLVKSNQLVKNIEKKQLQPVKARL